MHPARRSAILAASLLWIAPFAASAADAGADGGTDTDTEPCDGACAEEFYNACACGTDDPCAWAGDGVCDEACVELGYVDAMFDDSADCDPLPDGGADTDVDADTDTDTGADAGLDASTGGIAAADCSCTAVGRAAPAGLLSLLADAF